MKTKLITLVLISAAFLAGSARAQTATIATPTSPAPTVTPAALVPNQTVYGQRLPSVAELTNIAAAQGLTVVRIEQTASQVTIVYGYPNGQTNTVAYLLLPNAAGAATAVPTTTAPAPTVVYYEAAPRVVYYDSYPGYYAYPGYWYPPVSIGLGFGFRGGGFHGGYGGGFHGGFRH